MSITVSKNEVAIKATVRIVSVIKNKPLTEAEVFEMKVKIPEGIEDSKPILDTFCRAEARLHFGDVFRARLKTDIALKRKIGGIRCTIDLMHLDILED